MVHFSDEARSVSTGLPAPRRLHADELFSVVYPQLVQKKCDKVPREDLEVSVPIFVDPQPPNMDTKWSDPRWLGEQFQKMDHKTSYCHRESEVKIKQANTARFPVHEEVKKVPANVKAQQLYMNKLRTAQYQRRQRKKAIAAVAGRQNLIKLSAMQRAIRRLGAVAVTTQITQAYTRTLRGSVMDAEMMDQFLKIHFQLTLNPDELGCTMKWFDANGDGRVDVTEFLREFYKFGQVEHMRLKAIKIQKAARDQAKTEKYLAQNRFAGGPMAHSFKPYQYFTPEHFESAQNSLRNVAAAFQAHSSDGMQIRDIFHSGPMPASIFAATIKRVFNIGLQPFEILALAGAHPSQSGTTVDTAAFYEFFTKLGREERQRRNLERLRSNKYRQYNERRFQQNAAKRFAPKYKARVVWPGGQGSEGGGGTSSDH